MGSTILVNSYNFPPPAPTAYNDPLDWTLIQSWETGSGDMVAIDAAFNGLSGFTGGVIWSLDGTVITLASTGEDRIRSFSCSTPWDPDTATLIATRTVTNAIHLFASADGTLIIYERSTDTMVGVAVTNFTINGSAETGAMNKAASGHSGSVDRSFYPIDDLSYMYVDGPGLTRIRQVDFTGGAGDFDNPILGQESTINWTQNGSVGGSKISKDGTRIYRGAGTAGVEILEMSTPFDLSTITSIGTFDNDAEVGFSVDTVWVNPEDTTEVWVVGTSGLQLARMATNA